MGSIIVVEYLMVLKRITLKECPANSWKHN